MRWFTVPLLVALAFARPAFAEEALATDGRQKELEEAVKAARDAATSAKVAAEAAKAMAEAFRDMQAKSAPAPVPAPPPPPEPAKKDEKPSGPPPWAYQVGVNFINITGNANNVAGKLAMKVDGKWGDWSVGVKGGAAYGQASQPDAGVVQVTAQNADGQLRGDRGFGDTFALFVQGGALTDRVASISLQAFGEGGLGIKWWNVTEGDFVKSKFSTDFGFRYTRENRFRYFAKADAPAGPLDGNNIVAPRAAGSLRYAITRTSMFVQDVELLYDVFDSANLRMTSTTALSAQIDKGFALQIGVKARYIGKPAPGAQTLDTETGAGLTFAF